MYDRPPSHIGPPDLGLASASGISWLHTALRLISLVFLAAPLPGRAEDSIRCGNRLVSVEALAPAVIASCGEPSFRDIRELQNPGAGLPDQVWYYDLGPNQLVRVLSFRDQRLEKIETAGYGFSTPGAAGGPCSPTTIQEGISKYRLMRLCGAPVSKRVESVRMQYPPVQAYRDAAGRLIYGGSYGAPVYRETWVYNFGPARFLRRVTLENGVVARWDDEDQRGY